MTCCVIDLYTLNLYIYMYMIYFITHMYHFIQLVYTSFVFLSHVICLAFAMITFSVWAEGFEKCRNRNRDRTTNQKRKRVWKRDLESPP